MNPVNLYKFRSEAKDYANIDCSICLESVKDTNCLVHTNGGDKHPIHEKCLNVWLLNSHLCPFCKATISDQSLLSPAKRIVVHTWRLGLMSSREIASLITKTTVIAALTGFLGTMGYALGKEKMSILVGVVAAVTFGEKAGSAAINSIENMGIKRSNAKAIVTILGGMVTLASVTKIMEISHKRM